MSAYIPDPAHPPAGSSAEDKDKPITITSAKVKVGVIFLTSFIVLYEAARACKSCSNYEAWAVACSVISFVFSLLLLIFTDVDHLTGPRLPLGTPEQYLALFFFIWWAAGAGSMTFKAPFREAGNGFIASWVAFAASCSLMSSAFTSHVGTAVTKAQQAGRDVMHILVASIILMLQGAVDADDGDGYVVWAIICACLSIVLCLVAIAMSNSVPLPLFAAFMLLWWGAAVQSLTIFGPYNRINNGYLSTWMAFLSAVHLAARVFGFYNEDGTFNITRKAGEPSSAPTPSAPPHLSYGQAAAELDLPPPVMHNTKDDPEEPSTVV